MGRIYGIIHNNKYYPCDVYEHITAVRELNLDIPGLNNLCDEWQYKLDEFANGNQGSPYNWHIYTTLEDEAISDILHLIYDANVVRVADYKESLYCYGYAKGLQANIKCIEQLCKDNKLRYAPEVEEPIEG